MTGTARKQITGPQRHLCLALRDTEVTAISTGQQQHEKQVSLAEGQIGSFPPNKHMHTGVTMPW